MSGTSGTFPFSPRSRRLFKNYDLPDAAPLLQISGPSSRPTKRRSARNCCLAPDGLPLPPELYASNLEQFGIDIPPAEL